MQLQLGSAFAYELMGRPDVVERSLGCVFLIDDDKLSATHRKDRQLDSISIGECVFRSFTLLAAAVGTLVLKPDPIFLDLVKADSQRVVTAVSELEKVGILATVISMSWTVLVTGI